MELEAASRRPRLLRMEDQDRTGDEKLQTFGKRCRSAKRDPNCPVVIRGWLNKKDSAGLKLWKRRWFVLSNYCLFYYKDSREESVLGSIPLPSYNILFCTPRECKNRKYTFKVVHQGMRSYFFSADTQEDMLGWVRALSQSAAMESDSSMNRRCSSYQDFTQIGGSSESVVLPPAPSVGDGLSHKPRHVSRTLSEPSHLTGGRMGTPHSDQRGRRSVRQSPSPKTPSPPEFSRRRGCGPNQEEDSLVYVSGLNTPPKQTEFMGTGSLTRRGQLGSRPHTPVGRVDIRPQDDPMMTPQTLCYAPASPKLEFKSNPHTPVTERWQNISKPIPTYGSVHHNQSGRRPLGKSYSTGAQTDLLPPLPPTTRAAHSPHPPHLHHHHHHHHRSHLSVCVLPPALVQPASLSLLLQPCVFLYCLVWSYVQHVLKHPPKPDLRDTPPIRPLESDADAVLTRLCGCDKLLQSLSIELAQLQVDKDSVQCALEMTRLQLEDWRSQSPQAQEGALTQKALLQEELVTIRARMCDVSLEMERVWSQYERMESELSVIRSQLQHICNFGMPQEQSQAQRELWMMEDILAGLKVNRGHFSLLLGLQSHHISSAFQMTAPHPGSPGPSEGLHTGLATGAELDPPARPPLPQELQETNQSRDQGHGWMDLTYEGVYISSVDPSHRRGNSQPELHHDRTRRGTSESQSSSKWTTPETTIQSTKKVKMSEEEQIERMKRNQKRLANQKKPPMPGAGGPARCQSSAHQEEAPFPLRVTRVVTAVLPSSLVARRVSVEDPPPELATALPEQIPDEMQQRPADQTKKILTKPHRRLETPETQNWSQEETAQDLPGRRQDKALQDLAPVVHQPNVSGLNRSRQHHNMARSSRDDPRLQAKEAGLPEGSKTRGQDQAGLGDGGATSDSRAEGWPSVLLTPDLDPDLSLTPEQREAKLRRVERIRERVIRSAVRESAIAPAHPPIKRERQEVPRAPPTPTSDTPRESRETPDSEPRDDYRRCRDSDSRRVSHGPAELRTSSGTSRDEDEGDERKNQLKRPFGNKTQHKDYSGRKGAAKHKIQPPSSSSHTSSVTVYQGNGGTGFRMDCSDETNKELEELNSYGESSPLSTNLRTEWFLSTNQWQGFIPLQNHGIEPLCDEEILNINDQLEGRDSVNDSNEISSVVTQSLEKMRENHSLFYKIACDISISDTDITRNDGNSNIRTPSRSDERTELLTNESIPEEEVCSAERPSDKQSQDSGLSMSSKSLNASSENNGDSLSTSNKHPDSTLVNQDTQATVSAKAPSNTSTMSAKELCIYEDIPEKEIDEDNSRQESGLRGTSDQGVESDQASDKRGKTGEENHEMKESEEMKVDQERSEELKKASSLCEESKEPAQDRGSVNSKTQSRSVYGGGRAAQSASLGKTRVTVLRTSL